MMKLWVKNTMFLSLKYIMPNIAAFTKFCCNLKNMDGTFAVTYILWISYRRSWIGVRPAARMSTCLDWILAILQVYRSH